MFRVKRNYLAHKSLFTYFFGLYMLILLVPILISGSMYLRSLAIIRQEIDNSNTAVLEKIRLTIDSRLLDLDNTTATLSFSSNVIRLVTVQNVTADDRLVMAKIIQNLANVAGSNQFIKSIFLNLRNLDTVLTPLNSMTKTEFFLPSSDPLYNDTGWNGRLVKLSLDNSVVSASRNTDTLSLAYFRSLPLGGINDTQALLAIILDPFAISAIMTGNSKSDGAAFFIVDSDGQYFGPETTLNYELPDILRQLGDRDDIQYLNVNDEELVISQTRSEQYGLRYLSITPSNIYNQRIDSIRGLYLLSLTACLLLGGLMAVYFARRNYNPIKEIAANIVGNPMVTHKNFNEYDIIRESIRQIIGENDDTKKLVRAQKANLKDTFLNSLIKGNQNDSEYIAGGLTFFDIRFDHPDFAVLICSFDRFSAEGYHQEKSLIKQQAEQLFGLLGCCIMLDVDDGAIGLLNLPVELQADRLKETACQLIDNLKNNNKLLISIALSSVYPSLQQIGIAYREAEHALEYRMLVGSGSVINFPDIKSSIMDRTVGGRPPYNTQMLTSSLKSSDIESARTILSAIINDEFYSRNITIPIAKCKMSVLIDIMMTAMDEMMAGVHGDSALDKSACIESLLACKTIAELRLTMEDALDQIEVFILHSRNEKSEQLKNDVLAYIEDHYREIDFNVSNIAYRFGMSIDGMSRFFKRKMNTGPLAYINEKRIESAIALMNQDINFNALAVSVGFSNADTFIRVFKKLKGITPGKYREMLAEKKPD